MRRSLVVALLAIGLFASSRARAAPPLFVRPISHVVTRQQAVAITFDACATRTHGYGFDRPIYEYLSKEKIPATIFVSGHWVETHADAMEELARDPLIEFGDHSYDHPHMSRLPPSRMAAEIDETEAALGHYGKHSVAFRPPFGDWNRRLIEVVQGKQLPVVTWDVVSGDPSAKTTTRGMIHTVLSKARAGSIIIFHINGRGWKTAQALPDIVSGLRERGFHFVHLSELLASEPGRLASPAPQPLPAATRSPPPPAPLDAAKSP